MVDKKDQERLTKLREKLYERGEGPHKYERTPLTDEKVDVPTSWNKSARSNRSASEQRPVYTASTNTADTEVKGSISPETMGRSSRKKAYRIKLLTIGIFFFVASILLSSLFILFGGNTISGENISISITGPFTIGGGDIMPIQVGITNHNSVPIQSATLVVEYPLGTQSAEEAGRELFTERIPLNEIDSGETLNLPLKAQVFGEENQELTIRASVEYRVRGSNATFYKESDPLRFKVSSSPIVISIDSVRNISSGQEADVKMTITSNSPTTLSDILVKAEYPNGFDFTSSDPSPVSGQNVWSIPSLDPEESTTITIKGLVTGTETEERAMNFSVGVPNERDRFSLASIFAVASTEFLLEEPFLDVSLSVDGDRDGDIAISPGDQSNVSVTIKNTLSNTIYDEVVELKLSGNALPYTQVNVNNGYYNSNTRTITWDISSAPSLESMVPGDSQNFSFSLKPDTGSLLTPQLNIDVSVKARRVSESRAEEELVGTSRSTIKIETGVELRSETGRDTAAFADLGPVPPVVGNTSSYTITWLAQAGSNNISNTVVSATLPSYVTWKEQTSGSGTFSYNPSTRVVEWKAGSINANSAITGAFQVSILPSTSQIGKTPTIVGSQSLRANDDFTGTAVRANASALTTRLSEEAGYSKDSGAVRAN